MCNHSLLILNSLVFISLLSCVQEEEIKHPNVIYIFPDQFRNQAMGFWGESGFKEKINFKNDPVYTPNLNAFAKESVVLSHAQSNCPLSSPHRGSLLTGMYPHLSGVPINCNSDRPISNLREDLECISDVFSKVGYDCAYFGKLHVDFPTPNDPGNPGHYVDKRRPAWDAYTPKSRRHGFNYWYSYGTFDDHKNPHYWDTDGKKHSPKEWSPLHEAKMVIKYLKNEGNVRDPKKPFFIMVGMNPPHSPYSSLKCCMEEDYNLYKDRPIDSLLVRPNANKEMKKAICTPYYYASVTGIDRAFGQIVQALKESGMDKNTIVVFSSDHGETMCSQGVNDAKNSPYSESMNVPFLVRYPQKLQPHVDDILLGSPDIMPTLLGLAGLSESIPSSVQGRNLAPLFFNPKANITRPEGVLYIQNIDGEKNKDGKIDSFFPSARGFKSKKYTFALYIDREEHKLIKSILFDDEKDPYQLNNLSLEAHSDIVKDLCKQMGKVLKEINDPWYKENILNEMIPY